MTTFRAIRIDKTDAGTTASYVDFARADLMGGDVTVRVSHSTVNYKDGLALTGKSPVVRRFPMIPGIDFAGTVEASTHTGYKPGDSVILNGWGVGETHLGGYAQIARVPGGWLVPLPAGMSAAEAMAVGTAGYTAMLCLMALEKHGAKPADGPALVTGAAGGVGSVAVALLKQAGWRVLASTGRPEEEAYLKGLGADEIIPRQELSDPATVAPFILRGVALLGVNSVTCPLERRLEAWRRLASDLDRKKLAAMTTHIPFDKVIEAGPEILAGKVRGRIVVDIPG